MCLMGFGQVSDFEEFKRQRQQEMQRFGDDYRRGLDSLREARDKAFARMLQGDWTSEELFERPVVDATPKPDLPPVFKPTEEETVEAPPVIHAEPERDEPLTESVETEIEEASPPLNEQPVSEESEDASLSPAVRTERRYGSKFTLRRDSLFGNVWMLPIVTGKWPVLDGDPNPNSISAYWTACAAMPYEDLLSCIQFQQSVYGLSDWGTYQMIQKLASWNFKKPNDRLLFQWFFLVQLGYDAHLMYGDQQVVLTLPFADMLYSRTYFEQGNRRYFVLQENTPRTLYTYASQHESAQQWMTLQENPASMYPDAWTSRSFQFYFGGKQQEVQIPFLSHRVRYDRTIPQTELDFYFHQPNASNFNLALHQALDEPLSALGSDRERVRFLYALVCQSIPYQTDDEQFQQEKFCLPEEVLAYPFADCEDRTFFLNALIRELIGAETIGLNYPGHVAMAVRLDQKSQSDAIVEFDGVDYIYCDPTYIGADLGMMPEVYRNQRPEVFR